MAEYRTLYGDIRIRIDEREHYHERARRAAEEELMLTVYVPREEKPDNFTVRNIRGCSGIVGSPDPSGEGMVRIHFEGNIHQAVNLHSYSEKIRTAADRHVTAYPTTAMGVVPESELIAVGNYDVASNTLFIAEDRFLLVDDWTGGELSDSHPDATWWYLQSPRGTK